MHGIFETLTLAVKRTEVGFDKGVQVHVIDLGQYAILDLNKIRFPPHIASLTYFIRLLVLMVLLNLRT
jgi:hypothetical protein